MSILTVICVIALIVVITMQIGKSEKQQTGNFTTERFVHEGEVSVILNKSRLVSGSVDLPKDITTIGYAVFKGMTEITNVNIHEKTRVIGVESFESCSKINSLYTGEGVEIIEERAFCACNNLAQVKIGPRIKEIKSEAFKNCSKVSTIILESTTPPSAFTSSFEENVKNTCTLLVPKGCASNYLITLPWSQFKNIVED